MSFTNNNSRILVSRHSITFMMTNIPWILKAAEQIINTHGVKDFLKCWALCFLTIKNYFAWKVRKPTRRNLIMLGPADLIYFRDPRLKYFVKIIFSTNLYNIQRRALHHFIPVSTNWEWPDPLNWEIPTDRLQSALRI